MAASQGVLIDVAGAILDGARSGLGLGRIERRGIRPRVARPPTGRGSARRRSPPRCRSPPKTRARQPTPASCRRASHRASTGAIYACSSGSAAAPSARSTAPGTRGSIARSRSSSCPLPRRATAPRATTIIEEGRLLARVRHPNVVTIYGAERIGDQVGLWMEFVRGLTLEQASSRGRPSARPKRSRSAFSSARAVAAVHGAGLLHRDIKAHNVMLAEDGRVVLMDFGTGRELGDALGRWTRRHAAVSRARVALPEPSPRSGATSTASACCSITSSPGRIPVRAAGLRDLRSAHDRGERIGLGQGATGSPAEARRCHRARDQPAARASPAECRGARRRSDGAQADVRQLIPFAAALGVAAVVTLVVVDRDRHTRSPGAGCRRQPQGSPSSGAGAAATSPSSDPSSPCCR